MPLPNQTYLSDNETLIRENLFDLISNLDPAEAPLHALLYPVRVTQRMPEYGIDQFSLQRTVGNIDSEARQEGAAATYKTPTYPTRLRSVCQIDSDAFDVSETDRATNIAGISDPFDYRVYQTMVEVVNKQEMALHWGPGAPVTGATTVSPNVRVMQGLVSWCAYTGIHRYHTTVPATVADPYGVTIAQNYYSNFYDAQGTTLSRGIFNQQIMGNAWQNGFQVAGSVVLAGQALKSVIAEFAVSPNGTLNERTVPARDKFFVDTIEAIETPMGICYINLDRYMSIAGDSLVIDDIGLPDGGSTVNLTIPTDETLIAMMPRHVQIGVLRGAGFRKLGDDGDSTKGMIVGEETLIVRNPKALTGGTNLLS